MNDRFRVIFETVNEGVLVIAVDTFAFIDANPQICALFGYTRAEMLALDVSRLSADVEPAAIALRTALRERAAAGESLIFEWSCRTKSSRVFWCEIGVRRARLDERDVFFLSARDISARRAAQDEVAYRDRVLKAVTVTAADVVLGKSFEPVIVDVLKAVGTALNVDRLSILKGSHNAVGLCAEVLFTWQTSDRVSPLTAAEFPGAGSAADIAAWFEPMREGRPVISYADASAGFVQGMMRQMKTQSILLVPIQVDRTYWGHVGVDDCHRLRRWTSVEIDAVGVFAQVVGSFITRQRAQTKLQESELRFRTLSETVTDGIVIAKRDGVIVFWNRAAERIFGYSAAEANGKHINEWLTSEPFRIDVERALSAYTAGDVVPPGRTMEVASRRKDGIEITIELSINALAFGSEQYALSVVRDVTQRNRASALIERMGRFDVLTQLPNRRVFIEELAAAIVRAPRSTTTFAVLSLDLDRFKDVNDALGHPTGDRLLQAVAARLQASVRDTDIIARFGGDEFAAIVSDVREPADAARLATKIVAALAQPFRVDGNVIHTGTSIGIDVYGPNSSDAETLMSHADVALYRAKLRRHGTYRFYTEDMDAEVRARVSIDSELRRALADHEFFVAYQPQVDFQTGRIVGIEALARWQHPQRGIVMPGEFIPAAERNGTIVLLGRMILDEACRQMKTWADAGIAPPVIAVNVSAVQFRTPLELVTVMTQVLARSGLPGALLELELTESVLMEASLASGDALVQLRALGVRIAIDDFGNGYSSFDYLRRFHVDRIKIPGTFIHNMRRNSSNASIVRGSLGLARELDIVSIAEGVETREQLALLGEWGCRVVQGFYFSKPLGAEKATAVLRAGTIVPAVGVA